MYTALNIGSKNIKVLTLNGKRVKTWSSLDIAGGLVRDGEILKPKEVGEAIDALFKSSGALRNNVIASVAGLPLTYRYIKLPKLNASQAEEAILRALKKEITLPLDELYIAWQPTLNKGEEQEYFVAGMPRNTVDTLLQTLEIAKVEPYLIDLRGLALARVANRSNVIIVNMEPDCFDIVAVTNGQPSVLHIVTPRGEGTTLEDNISQLANELTKITAFNQINSQNTQLSPATPLLLTGELAAEAMVSGLLQAQIEFQIEPLVPPVDFPKNLPVAEYTCTIGLALKKTALKPSVDGGAARFQDIDIDILAAKQRKPKAKTAGIKSLLPIIVLVAVICLLFPLMLARNQVIDQNQMLDTELTRINRLLEIAKVVDVQANETEATIADLTAQAAALKAANDSILGMRGYFGASLESATSNMPSTLYFTLIDISKDSITITGEADSTTTVIQYAQSLEAAGLFKEVRITQMDNSVATMPDSDPAVEVPIIVFQILCTQ
jgi:Tfp pilus assembly protein PilN